MVRFAKIWKLHSRSGKKMAMEVVNWFKKHKQPVKIVKMKKPIGLHTHKVYYKPLIRY